MQIDFSLINTSELPGNYSSVWTDYNNDGKADLYVSKCLPNTLPGHPARTNLYKNLGSNQFQEVGAQAHVDDNAQSWTSVFEDFDHDGDMDFLVINHDDNNRFYRNNGDGTFTDIIEFTGIDVFDPGSI
ncbi:MAG: VCBS repeat-containing protein [Saprospiraceae bacterium]|nr:VCBS repeat-containing protein [Saprospiraceae bacterium]